MLLKHILHKITDRNWLLLTLLILSISSCTPPITESLDSSPARYSQDDIESLTNEKLQAEQLAPPLRERQLINIAQRFFSIEAYLPAKHIVERIDYIPLDNTDYINYINVASRTYIKTQYLYRARLLLNDQRLQDLQDTLNIEQQKQYHQSRAELYHQTGDIITSLNELIILGTLLSESEDISTNNSTIWQQLSHLTPLELEALSSDINDPVLNGWLELAAISKRNQGSIESQNSAIARWVTTNTNHPASQQLPADLVLLQSIIQSHPKHIALLLPLKGKLAKAGQAIRDGFMAAYYRSKQHNKQEVMPTIRIYDSSADDINIVYDNAINNGATMVIGPLEKDKVQQLQERQDLNIPTLALNYSEFASDNEGTPFYQFGLSLEDEARQVADRAWLEGHRQAAIMSSKANWSQRAADAFSQRWQEYGGTIIIDNQFNNSESYSKTVENILHIDQSKQRASELKRLFGQSLEFEPRRRSDIDMIFLVSRSREGRQIKPALNFHYAGNVPVYATSQIYSSANTTNKNSDLNNIRLTTLPWTLNQSVAEKTLIESKLTVSPGYERLYALGVDSFLLYPRLEQLYQLENQQLYGATGKLSINTSKRVTRQQLWAKIYKGKLQPLRELTLSSENTL